MIVDEIFGQTRQGYYLVRVYHLDGHTLRVRVERDAYQAQSSATVEVLNPQLTWTPLATAPPAQWHQNTPPRAEQATALDPIADQLLARARRILTPPPR